MLSRAGLIKTALTVTLLVIVFALSMSADFYNSSIIDAFMAMALAGALVMLLVVQPSSLLMNLAMVTACSLALAGTDYRVMGFQPRLMAAFSFAGLSSLAVLGTRAIWARNSEYSQDRTLLLHAFLAAGLFVASEYMASTLLDYTEALHPKTFDLYLYSFDCSLGVQFSFLAGQVFSRLQWLRVVGLLFYIALPLPLALVYAAHLALKNKTAFPVMLAFLVTGPIGVLYYNMVPATGPVHIFGPGFPWHPLPTSQVRQLVLQTIALKGARNAIPSLHMAWVLLAWWSSRGLARCIRAIALAFVVFTILATLATGEHYFVDLVVAFPFALMVQAACLYPLPFKSGPRRVAFLFGTFASLLWMALVSFATPLFWISPVVPWTLVALTIAASIWQAHRLQRAGIMQEEQRPTFPEWELGHQTGGLPGGREERQMPKYVKSWLQKCHTGRAEPLGGGDYPTNAIESTGFVSKGHLTSVTWALAPGVRYNKRVGHPTKNSQTETRKNSMRKQKGFSLIELLIVVAIILIIAAIAIPNLLRARIAANESSAVASIRTVNTAMISYNSSYPTVGFAANLATLGGTCTGTTVPTSTAACLIDSTLAAGTKSGYTFAATATGTAPVGSYVAYANPITGNSTGVRSFCSVQDAVVRVTGTSSTSGCAGTEAPLQ